MKLTREQILKLAGLSITDQQLDALVILSSHPGGTTNRELTDLLGKEERDEGNVLAKIVQPLYLAGIICKMKFKYPNTLLFTNPNIGALYEIKTRLEVRILYYRHLDREKVEESRKKGLWLGQKGITFFWRKPITESHKKIRDRLVNYIRLHKWTDDILWIRGRDRGKEVDIIAPKCNFCRNLRNDINIKWHLYFEKIPNLDDIVESWVVDFPFRYSRQNYVPNEQIVRLQQEREEFYKEMGWNLKEFGEGSN